MSDLYPSLGFDPAPGDPETAGEIAQTIREVAGQGGSALLAMASVSDENGIWVGRAADAFTESFDEVPPYLERAVTSLEAAARCLDRWSTTLAGFQTRARQLEGEAETALAAVTAAQTAVDGYDPDAEDADEDEAERNETALTTANESLEEVRGRALLLQTEFTEAAEDTARELDQAADDAPAKPGLWDRLSDLVGEIVELVKNPNFWKGLGDLLANIAAVVGVICLALMLFAGGPATWLVMTAVIASLAAAGAHGAAMAMGHEGVGWDTIAFDLAGAAFGGIGLAAGKLIQGGRAMVTAGRALRSGAFRQLRFGDWARGVSATIGGHLRVFTGKVLDWTAAIAGNAVAGTDFGRNPHVPIVGPISDIVDAWNDGGEGSGANAAAPGGTAPTEALLTSAEDGFLNGLDQEFGVAA